MLNNLKYLCIIPARCGSKGIPLKNIVDIGGKPMLSYTADIALKLQKMNLIDSVFVSTDCKQIAAVANECGVEVPILRPQNISGDKAKSIDFVLDAIKFYENSKVEFDAVIVLQPTSPLKSLNDVKGAIRLFSKSDSSTLISAYREETINDLIMYHKEKDRAIALNINHNQGIRRQDHGSVYIRNGAIYISKTSFIKTEKKIVSDFPLLYEMSKNNSINVDTYEDLEYVRNIMCK